MGIFRYAYEHRSGTGDFIPQISYALMLRAIDIVIGIERRDSLNCCEDLEARFSPDFLGRFEENSVA
ncbi:hypothetical protein A9995_15455 [Erythrobacter sp. QSSC1-22B]|nr:hypothetical protein A9995_15455 [Erythrobacter sp. QSSC1-22B]